MDNSYNNMRRAVESRKQSHEEQQKITDQLHKQKIIQSVHKSLMTVAIGNIQRVEDNYGELWGHGKLYEKLNDSERAEYHRWQDMRGKILDDVHIRIRKIVSYLERYDFKFIPHSYDFSLGDSDEK